MNRLVDVTMYYGCIQVLLAIAIPLWTNSVHVGYAQMRQSDV